MDPFSRFGIKHLSASSLGLFRDDPALWALTYLHNVRDEAGPRMWLGTAVEAGLDAHLWQSADPLVAARKNFELDAQGDLSDECEEARAHIEPMLRRAVEAYEGLGTPDARQVKVECWLDGIDVPILGYLDHRYPDRIRDLKTTLRMPSEPRPDHAAQVAIYNHATGLPVELVYVTPKAWKVFPVEDCEAALRPVLLSARALRNQLALCSSKEDFAAIHWPNLNGFRWGETTKAKAAEIWT